MRRQDLAPDAADDQPLFAPVELEGFAQFKAQRYVGIDLGLPTVPLPLPDKGGDATVVAGKPGGLDFVKQFQ